MKRKGNSRLVYHFMRAEHALLALRSQKYKLSRLDQLNDPFELCGPQYTDPKFAESSLAFKKSMASDHAILCCSRDWGSMLLWSHYADSHKGMALEIEVPNNAAIDVVYTRNRPTTTPEDMQADDPDGALRIITTKSLDWAYEEEVRIFHSVDQKIMSKGEMLFANFNSEIKLRGLVLGALNQTSDGDIREAIPKGASISVTRTVLSDNSFEIVKSSQGSIYLKG